MVPGVQCRIKPVLDKTSAGSSLREHARRDRHGTCLRCRHHYQRLFPAAAAAKPRYPAESSGGLKESLSPAQKQDLLAFLDVL